MGTSASWVSSTSVQTRAKSCRAFPWPCAWGRSTVTCTTPWASIQHPSSTSRCYRLLLLPPRRPLQRPQQRQRVTRDKSPLFCSNHVPTMIPRPGVADGERRVEAFAGVSVLLGDARVTLFFYSEVCVRVSVFFFCDDGCTATTSV